MKQNNVLIYGAIAVAAYLLLSKKNMPAPGSVMVTPGSTGTKILPASNTATSSTPNILTSLVNSVQKLISPATSPGAGAPVLVATDQNVQATEGDSGNLSLANLQQSLVQPIAPVADYLIPDNSSAVSFASADAFGSPGGGDNGLLSIESM